jgi:glycosyltransferase involved in cell wall biosynthesis
MSQIRAIDIRLLGKKRTGDETVFFNLTKELLAQESAHTYLLLTNEQDPQKIASLQVGLGCLGKTNVRVVSLTGQNRFLWNLWTLPWFLLRHPVDVYHTQYILPLFVPRRTKVVTHIHDVSFRAFPKLIGWRDRLFLALFIPRSLRRADLIIAPTQFTKDEIIRYFGTSPEKILVIGNALSADFVTKESVDVELVREKYHLPARYIISVGTLQPRKNIPLLIRAFALLRKRLPDVSLVIVGNRQAHHYDTAIDDALASTALGEAVCFPGYIAAQDVPLVIRRAALFVFPSLYEGFGIPLLEAFSQRVPAVVSDIPCFHEVAGEAALYFGGDSEQARIASCAEKMYTLLTDMKQRADSVSRGEGRLSLFSWKKSAELLARAYEELQ